MKDKNWRKAFSFLASSCKEDDESTSASPLTWSRDCVGNVRSDRPARAQMKRHAKLGSDLERKMGVEPINEHVPCWDRRFRYA